MGKVVNRLQNHAENRKPLFQLTQIDSVVSLAIDVLAAAASKLPRVCHYKIRREMQAAERTCNFVEAFAPLL